MRHQPGSQQNDGKRQSGFIEAGYRSLPFEHFQAPPSSIQPAANVKPARQSPRSIEVVDGDLLLQKTDVIVNSWNMNRIPLPFLTGVAGAIKRAGGTAIFKELRDHGAMALGEARLTSAGRLPFKGIIHVAGIDLTWKSSERSVRESVKNALAVARNSKYDSIAFPAIGSGSVIQIMGKEFGWGVSVQRSIEFIRDEAAKSDFPGQVLIVRFKRGS